MLRRLKLRSGKDHGSQNGEDCQSYGCKVSCQTSAARKQKGSENNTQGKAEGLFWRLLAMPRPQTRLPKGKMEHDGSGAPPSWATPEAQ